MDPIHHLGRTTSRATRPGGGPPNGGGVLRALAASLGPEESCVLALEFELENRTQYSSLRAVHYY